MVNQPAEAEGDNQHHEQQVTDGEFHFWDASLFKIQTATARDSTATATSTPTNIQEATFTSRTFGTFLFCEILPGWLRVNLASAVGHHSLYLRIAESLTNGTKLFRLNSVVALSMNVTGL
jgi:hypothetical protein